MKSLRYWFDSNNNELDATTDNTIDWLRIIPFIVLHLACLAIFWVGVSPVAVITAAFLYLIRMFAITAFYHRFFAHKSFKTSRPVQFIFAAIGASSTQRGPIWWAAHHRQHHRHADTASDPHSPNDGLLWSHLGWFLTKRYFQADYRLVKDLTRYPELRWLDRFDIAMPVILAIALFGFGEWLKWIKPEWQTNGWQMLVWGYFISTVVLLHATLLINSLAHKWGKRRYNTEDGSRNNFWLALLTLGEGWHNNHHYHASSARQGFYWWEIDISFYLLVLMKKLGLVWDMRTISADKRDHQAEIQVVK